MPEFKSFNNSIQKLSLLWEQNEDNKITIDNNFQKLNINFNSLNFTKKFITFPIINKQLISLPLQQFTVVSLENFPEWILNHINIFPIITPIGDINTDTIYTTLQDANNSGNAKIGDLIIKMDMKFWLAHLKQNNYLLKIYQDIRIQSIKTINPISGNVSDTQILPSTLDLTLKIINPRIYEKFNLYKQ